MLACSCAVTPFTAGVGATINFQKIWIATLHDEKYGKPHNQDESWQPKQNRYNPKQQLHGSNEK